MSECFTVKQNRSCLHYMLRWVNGDLVAMGKVWMMWIQFGAHPHVCFETVVDRHFTLIVCCIADFHKMCVLINPRLTFSLLLSPFLYPYFFHLLSSIHVSVNLFCLLAYIQANGVCHRSSFSNHEANLETLQFWQVGLYLEAGSIDEPIPFQFPFDSLIGVYMYM